MAKRQNLRGIPLPSGWPRHVTSATLHVIALAQYAMAYTRSWAVNSPIARQRLQAENDQLKQLVALLAEEICIKDTRTKRIAAPSRTASAHVGLTVAESWLGLPSGSQPEGRTTQNRRA